MNAELFGTEVNIWVDALVRLVIMTLVMTVVVMALIYLERKALGRFQMRLGPTRTGPAGILQSVADALKLVGKEDVRPRGADPWVFELAPYIVFIPIFMMFVAIPFAVSWEIRSPELGLIYVLAVSSVNILGWIMAGWGSDNRYAIIGALRAAAQGISYEIPLVLALVSAGMFAGTFNLASIAEAQGHIPFIVWQPMAFMIFFIAMLAELNRPPFDIPVGESEVVGGPFIEYSGIRWSMFFLAEYAALFIMALIGSTVFLGGWAWPLGEEVGVGLQFLLTVVKAGLLIFIVFWVRATAPRLRIDQLMGFAWKVLIPLVFVQVMVNGLVMLYEWPDVVLLVAGLAGCAALAWSIGYSVRLPRPARRPVPARSEAAS